MIISCESCQARFRLADEKLKPGGTRVRCSKCQHVFTVMPPEAAPAEEPIDFGAFNMEPVSEGETPPPTSLSGTAPTPASDADVAESGAREFDFSAMERASGLADEGGAHTDRPAAPEAPDQPGPAFGEAPSPTVATEMFGEFSFAAKPMEGDDSSPVGEFDFEETASADDDTARPAERQGEEPGEVTAGTTEPAPGEFAFTADTDSEPFAFDEAPAAPPTAGSFSLDEQEENPLFEGASTFGEEETSDWAEPGTADALSFDFDEPSFTAETEKPLAESGRRGELEFGEIDLGEAPQFTREPEPAPPAATRAVGPDVAPPPPQPQRAATPRQPVEEPLPGIATPHKSSTSKSLLILVLLLLLLCAAGGYFYMMGDGQQLIARVMNTLKGEEPAAPVEQRIGLTIAGSSYVDNRDAGQLLVIQGSATNNFGGARSAITVKGILVDANGKSLQQQTVFCGNYLSEEKLRILKYAQIEEAMNNQFGDSLTNMNVKPGAAIRFTIVFRNLPQNLANINVEVVDSKPGGL
jgi:predicted Zn finger-like uncharacterized protein